MTPKEKAEELVSRYRKEILKGKYRVNGFIVEEICQECALIAVDEIIDAIDWHKYEAPNDQLNFWFEVKREIVNLN